MNFLEHMENSCTFYVGNYIIDLIIKHNGNYALYYRDSIINDLDNILLHEVIEHLSQYTILSYVMDE